MERVSDFNILAMFTFTKYQIYVERKHWHESDNSGENDKYLNVYRYLGASKFGKLLVIWLDTVDKKTYYVNNDCSVLVCYLYLYGRKKWV